jgi:hypothetical protein
LNYNDTKTDFTVQEVFVWGGQNVLGVTSQMNKAQIDEKLRAPISSGPEPVSPNLKAALGWLFVDTLQFREYTVDKYVVKFYFEHENGPWTFASIKAGSTTPRPVVK